MTTKDLKDSKVVIPVWLMTIIITVFLSLIAILYNDITSRLDRIESKIDSHLLLSNTIKHG
jgi:hypothetical protein